MLHPLTFSISASSNAMKSSYVLHPLYRATPPYLLDLGVEQRHEVELGRARRPQHVVAGGHGDGGVDGVLAELLVRVGVRVRVTGLRVGR
eukprot:scaffold19095_cov38-Phaeocystis_antarctica.AAC.1